MKFFIVFLIFAVGCCLCHHRFDENVDLSCRQFADVASTANLIFRDAPAFTNEILDQVQRRAFHTGLTQANTRTIFKPLLGLIRKLLMLVDQIMDYQFPNGDNVLIVIKDTVFKAINTIAGEKVGSIMKVIDPLVTMIISTLHGLLKIAIPKIIDILKTSD